ncbi:hypothetical protein B4117_3714 [Bacillus mycoides]|nr:hypothetical protein B4117_3714 [Bacillus mycoides]
MFIEKNVEILNKNRVYMKNITVQSIGVLKNAQIKRTRIYY